MRALVVAEFYPRTTDPTWGVWAHRQALAARDAGAEVHVVVLHRPVPASRELRDRGAWRRALGEPRHRTLDGLPVTTVRYASPPRPGHYGRWGRYAAPQLAVTLARLRRTFRPDLVHAHNAVPAADALLRAGSRLPLVTSVHGGDVLFTAKRDAWRPAVARAFTRSRVVLANSDGIALAVQDLAPDAPDVRVLRLGTDVPPVAATIAARGPHTVVTVGQLVARKRQGDVLRALWVLRDRHPDLRYLVIGEGPDRPALEALAERLGLAGRVTFTGRLPHAEALRLAREATVFAMPSVDEAFGVAYVEAMAGGLPAIGALGEPGPAEIARAGQGMVLVPPGDPEVLAGELGRLLDDPAARARLGADARATVRRAFTWEACGRATVAAYEDALR